MARRGRGEGSITRKPDGKFLGMITVGINPKNGNPIRKSITTKTRREAADWVNEQNSAKKKGELVQNNKIKLAEWVRKWLDIYKKVAIKQPTYDNYSYLIDKYIIPAIGEHQIQKLTIGTIQMFISNLMSDGLSARTTQYVNFILRSALKQAVTNNLISKNPCEGTVLPKKVKKPIRILTIEEIAKLKSCLESGSRDGDNYYLYPAFLLQMSTGLRRGEVLGLFWENVNLAEGYIEIKQQLVVSVKKGVFLTTPKTAASVRRIPLPAMVIDVLAKYKADKLSGFVFTTATDNYIHPRNYTRSFKMFLNKAGLPKIRLHDLRHTFTTLMICNGADIKMVSEIIGHTDVNFTASVYTHPTMEMKRKAMCKMDEILSPSAEAVH